MTSIVSKLRRAKFLGAIFHTLDYCLQRELWDSKTVLDLGCGPASPIRNVKSIKHSVGVETFGPYLEISRKNGIHDEYLNKMIEEIEFPENSFDAVILIEVLEHLEKETGRTILQKAEKWARKKIIISTPNGFFPMGEVDDNEFQKHRSGWEIAEFQALGFEVFGLGGLKFFYVPENEVETLSEKEEIFANIRFRPQKFFYVINAFFQIIIHYWPRYSFGLLAVKSKR